MTLAATMAAAAPASWVSSFLKALSALFGADTEPLSEDAVLRLVAAARAGDRTARQRLYRQHVNRVFRTVRALLRSDAEAEDVTQDAMLIALTSLDRYSPRAGTRFAAWLTTIAVNTARRRFRYGSDLNATEIAAHTGIGAANVRKILERARLRLAERIEALMKSAGVAA